MIKDKGMTWPELLAKLRRLAKSKEGLQEFEKHLGARTTLRGSAKPADVEWAAACCGVSLEELFA